MNFRPEAPSPDTVHWRDRHPGPPNDPQYKRESDLNHARLVEFATAAPRPSLAEFARMKNLAPRTLMQISSSYDWRHRIGQYELELAMKNRHAMTVKLREAGTNIAGAILEATKALSNGSTLSKLGDLYKIVDTERKLLGADTYASTPLRDIPAVATLVTQFMGVIQRTLVHVPEDQRGSILNELFELEKKLNGTLDGSAE